MWDHVTLPLHHTYTLDIAINVIYTCRRGKWEKKCHLKSLCKTYFPSNAPPYLFIYVSSVMCVWVWPSWVALHRCTGSCVANKTYYLHLTLCAVISCTNVFNNLIMRFAFYAQNYLVCRANCELRVTSLEESDLSSVLLVFVQCTLSRNQNMAAKVRK